MAELIPISVRSLASLERADPPVPVRSLASLERADSVEPAAEIVAGQAGQEVVAVAEVVEPRGVGPLDRPCLDHIPEVPQAMDVGPDTRLGIARGGARLEDEWPVARLEEQ